MEQFRQCTYGHPEVVQADDKSLKNIMAKPLLNALERLQSVDATLVLPDTDQILCRRITGANWQPEQGIYTQNKQLGEGNQVIVQNISGFNIPVSAAKRMKIKKCYRNGYPAEGSQENNVAEAWSDLRN